MKVHDLSITMPGMSTATAFSLGELLTLEKLVELGLIRVCEAQWKSTSGGSPAAMPAHRHPHPRRRQRRRGRCLAETGPWHRGSSKNPGGAPVAPCFKDQT